MKIRVTMTCAPVLAVTLVACGSTVVDALYPTTSGLTWEYQVAVRLTLGTLPGQRLIISNLPPRELNGRTVTPQKAEILGQTSFSFLVSDTSGSYEYARQPAGAAGPEILSTPNYYLKYPLAAGATWESRTITSLLMERVSVPTTVVVESVGETVTVPAGTYSNCVKTRTAGKTTTNNVENFGVIRGTLVEVGVEHQAWFCPRVGLVKTIRRESSNHIGMGSGDMSSELAAFKG